MRASFLRAVIGSLLTLVAAGCGGGSSSSSIGNMVTLTFTGGTPTAAAVQTGTGAFTPATIQSNKLSIIVPSGTTKYSVAYVCPPILGFGNTVSSEFVIQASTLDGTAFTVSCFLFPPTGTATGNANAMLIPGATDVRILGDLGVGGPVGSNNGSFSVSMPTGTNDVAAVAVDGAIPPNVLAVHMVRAQTVPGAINGGSTILFAVSDVTTPQSLTVRNVPAGFVSPPAVAVEYHTANGTSILLDSTSATQYPAVPSAAAQSGDFYFYESNTDDTATHNSAVGITHTTTTGGGATTIALPASWSFSGPTAATFPTFTFNYSGFAGLAAVAQQAEIEWAPTPTTLTTITVTATANFQSGANTITIPNLTSVAGFFAPAPTGTNISWVADIFGGTTQDFVAPLPANASLSFVQNRGNYTEP